MSSAVSGAVRRSRHGGTWHGRPASFEGASVARFSNAGITYLREYQTVAELYDWDGAWRD